METNNKGLHHKIRSHASKIFRSLHKKIKEQFTFRLTEQLKEQKVNIAKLPDLSLIDYLEYLATNINYEAELMKVFVKIKHPDAINVRVFSFTTSLKNDDNFKPKSEIYDILDNYDINFDQLVETFLYIIYNPK